MFLRLPDSNKTSRISNLQETHMLDCIPPIKPRLNRAQCVKKPCVCKSYRFLQMDAKFKLAGEVPQGKFRRESSTGKAPQGKLRKESSVGVRGVVSEPEMQMKPGLSESL